MKFLASSNHRDWILCLNSSCLLSIWMNCRGKFYNFSNVNNVVVFSFLNFYWHVSDVFVQFMMWQRLISFQKIEFRNQVLLKYTRVNLLNFYDEMHEKKHFVNQFVDMYFEKTTSFSLKKRRNVININENSNASLKEDELNNDEMKYEKKTKSWNALCEIMKCVVWLFFLSWTDVFAKIFFLWFKTQFTSCESLFQRHFHSFEKYSHMLWYTYSEYFYDKKSLRVVMNFENQSQIDIC